MSGALFDLACEGEPWAERLGPGTVLLHHFAAPAVDSLLADVGRIVEAAPLRHMLTPGGKPMSVAMMNCGALGWVSDRTGYRYTGVDPQSGLGWPPMPDSLAKLARAAAAHAGFPGFAPEACLINRYEAGTRLSLHQDRDERDWGAPIVSVSLGLPAVFLLGGTSRTDKPHHLTLTHGDVLVWGGPDRLRYHGVQPLQAGCHPVLGAQRLNLTFRKAT